MASNNDTLAQRLLAGDKRALARAISLVENDDPAGWEIVREVYPRTGRAAVIGVTGPPGAGKSTLQAALLMDAAGRDVVLLETVGVGQAEVDIIDHADTVVLVLMPGSGDSIQALKAGVMEIPDLIVVNKADHPLTDTMVREIKGVLALGPRDGWRVPVLRTQAANGDGVEEVLEKLAEHRAFIEAEGMLSERRRRNLRSEVLAIATYRLRRELEAAIAEDPDFKRMLDRVVSREIDPATAATSLLSAGYVPGSRPQAQPPDPR